MSSMLKRTLFGFVLAAIGFAGGTVFGFFNGGGAFVLIDSVPRGAIAAANLNALSAGKAEAATISLEYEVDNALSSYSIASDEWWFPLYKRGLFLTDPDVVELSIRRVATYRKHHPSLSHEDMFDQVPEEKKQFQSEYKELSVGIREHLRRVNAMVEKYADQ